MNLLYNISIGGVKLKIHHEDLEKAQNIIEEIKTTPLTDMEGKLVLCPQCQSTHIANDFKVIKDFKSLWVYFFTVGFLSAFLFPFFGNDYYTCLDCGHHFKKKLKN